MQLASVVPKAVTVSTADLFAAMSVGFAPANTRSAGNATVRSVPPLTTLLMIDPLRNRCP
jgi:hypothetical protein